MRCAADRQRAGRRARPAAAGRRVGARLAAAVTAGLAAVSLLAGCTGGGAGGQQTGRRAARGLHALPFGRGWAVPAQVITGGSGGVVTFIGAAGGPGGGGSRPKITVPPIPPASSGAAIQMPLEAYQAVSTQQQEALAQASTLLTQRCMAARGFDDTSVASPPFSSVASLEQIEAGGAGLTDLPQARTYGFARPKGGGAGVATGPAIIGYVGASSFGSSLKAGKAFTEALFGFFPGAGGSGHQQSCVQQASQEVYGSANGEPVSDPVPQIAQRSAGFTASDPRIRALNQAWSACMARRFYHYASPSQVQAKHWPKPPSKAEIRTAVADVECKTRVNYLNTWLAVEAAYQQALIGRDLTALSQLQANFAPLMRRAQAALTESNGLSASG
jgi:hypothetical protein